jgi:hypothetical protein
VLPPKRPRDRNGAWAFVFGGSDAGFRARMWAGVSGNGKNCLAMPLRRRPCRALRPWRCCARSGRFRWPHGLSDHERAPRGGNPSVATGGISVVAFDVDFQPFRARGFRAFERIEPKGGPGRCRWTRVDVATAHGCSGRGVHVGVNIAG